MTDRPPSDPVAAQPARQPASRQEKVDFLKQAVATTEGHVRAYDTKAQIALAAFVLSGNPLWAILRATCDRAAGTDAAIALLLVLIATILSYGYVIWPVAPAPAESDATRERGMFFIAHDFAGGSRGYLSRLDALVTEEELANEVLKLAYIRDVKSRRFRWALSATVLAYLVYLAAFLMLRNCGG